MFKKITASNVALFASVLFSSVILLSFDAYCKTEIITDIVFLKIAGLPFHRMEFISVIFFAAFFIGMLVEKLFKYSKTAASLAVSVLAVLVTITALLDTNLFQILVPTMRISHVTMSLSRILGILMGVSGLFAGIGCTYALSEKVSSNTAVWAVVLAVLLSTAMMGTGLYKLFYIFIAIILFGCALLVDYSKKQGKIRLNSNSKRELKSGIVEFLCAMFLSVWVLITPEFLTQSRGFGEFGTVAVVGGILLAAVALFKSGQFSVFTPIGLFFGAVLNYVGVHFLSQETIYSGNRVIYTVSLGVYFVIMVLAVVFLLVGNSFFKKNNKNIN